MENYNSKSKVEGQKIAIFQHKVEHVPHFTCVTELSHIWMVYCLWDRI